MAFTTARTGALGGTYNTNPFAQEQKPFDPFEGLTMDRGGGASAPAAPSAPTYNIDPAYKPYVPSEPSKAPTPAAPDAAAPTPGGEQMAAAAPALSGLAAALQEPGPGFSPDRSIDGAQPNLGVRAASQPLDILRQIVAQRGRAY